MKKFNTIGTEEIDACILAVKDAMDGHYPLSGYMGTRESAGPQCAALEKQWCDAFKVSHSVAVNSATSGLLAACMAVGVGSGDEVIVSPYTMSATAAAPKVLGAKVVFADIENETFCLDPVEVANLINAKTKAVVVTNLFGHPAKLHELYEICDRLGVFLIEDNAQSIGAREYGRFAGTIGHIGVFSLNVHKHIQVGEGGVCCTDSPILNKRLREAMNHGEARGGSIGLNLRMTEVTAAMARVQLKKLPEILRTRWHLAERISFEVVHAGLPIKIPDIRDDCTHSFYCWAGLLERGIKLKAPFKRGYLNPLYNLPVFMSTPLPVTEEVERTIVLVETCSIDPTDKEVVTMVGAQG